MVKCKSLVFAENDLRMTGGDSRTYTAHINLLASTLWPYSAKIKPRIVQKLL